MNPPTAVIPRHVRACQHSPDRSERWSVWVWDKAKPDNQTRIPYSCNSWRCPVCDRHEAAVTFARIKEALDGVSKAEPGVDGWVYLVGTLDRNAYYSREKGKKWEDVNQAYDELGKMSRKLLDRIGRVWGDETREERRQLKDGTTVVRHRRCIGNRWIATVEAHRSGWPHINMQIWAPALAAELRRSSAEACEDPQVADAVALARQLWRDKQPVPASVREQARRATLVQGQLRDIFEAAGFGRQSTAEASRDPEAVAAYGVKLAGLHEASTGELAKITQKPTNAPARFRRLRAGKGFLPARRKNEAVTGCLIQRRRSREGDWEIIATNAPAAPEHAEAVLRARSAELACLEEEEQLLARSGGVLPPLPPIRLAFAGKLESHLDTSERNHALRQRHLARLGWDGKTRDERRAESSARRSSSAA